MSHGPYSDYGTPTYLCMASSYIICCLQRCATQQAAPWTVLRRNWTNTFGLYLKFRGTPCRDEQRPIPYWVWLASPLPTTNRWWKCQGTQPRLAIEVVLPALPWNSDSRKFKQETRIHSLRGKYSDRNSIWVSL